jgi:pimeloyl-ACP methyl ester carboxylesterase
MKFDNIKFYIVVVDSTMWNLLSERCVMTDLPPPLRETYNCSLDGSRWPYLVQLPKNDPQAILIYLHGHYGDEQQGMTPLDYNDAFGVLRRELFARQWAYVCPWYGGNSWMGPMAEQGLADLLGILQTRWPGRPIILAGGSMGGSSALIFAHRRPELLSGVIGMVPAGCVQREYEFAVASADPTLQNVAAAIRIHYTADGHDLGEELRLRSAVQHAEQITFPVYLSWAGQDALVPPAGVRELAAKLKAQGTPVVADEWPEGGHDTPILEIDWERVLAAVYNG